MPNFQSISLVPFLHWPQETKPTESKVDFSSSASLCSNVLLAENTEGLEPGDSSSSCVLEDSTNFTENLFVFIWVYFIINIIIINNIIKNINNNRNSRLILSHKHSLLLGPSSNLQPTHPHIHQSTPRDYLSAH